MVGLRFHLLQRQPCINGDHLLTLSLLHLVNDGMVINLDEVLVVQLSPHGDVTRATLKII